MGIASPQKLILNWSPGRFRKKSAGTGRSRLSLFFSGFEFFRNFYPPSKCRAAPGEQLAAFNPSRHRSFSATTHGHDEKSGTSQTKRLRWVFVLCALTFALPARAAGSSYYLHPWALEYETLSEANEAGESLFTKSHPVPPNPAYSFRLSLYKYHHSSLWRSCGGAKYVEQRYICECDWWFHYSGNYLRS